ncbi:MAG: hypothetical protein QOH84_6934 [Kribbellaceae bacterium]|nr:hypothetical protein [Kribbellaceae bacterium]
MTTNTRTPDPPIAVQPRLTPGWMSWVPWATVGWTVAYGLVRLWFATGHAPAWQLPSDLLIPAWASVAACLVSAAAVTSLLSWPRSRVAIGAAWALAAGWVAACAFILLDLVSAVLPGLGIPFDTAGLLSRLGGLTGAALLAATALAKQRQLNPVCLRCTGLARRIDTRWALVAAWITVAGCATRLVAQAVVGFGTTPYGSDLSMVLFETGFLLTGIVLPLLLATRLGKPFPRWTLLLPGTVLGGGITAYFGVGLIQMVVAAAQGESIFDDIALPDSFFWVAVPAYLVWGVGLLVATTGYYLRTRKPCKGCGR